MKQIQQEVKTYVTKWEALDGAVFNSKEECEKYEQSAKIALTSVYKDLIVKSSDEYSLFETGSEEYNIDVVVVRKEEDITTILAVYAYFNGNLRIDEMREKCKKALENSDFLIINRGDDYSEDFWIAGTLYDRLHHIISSIDPTTTIRYEDVEN